MCIKMQFQTPNAISTQYLLCCNIVILITSLRRSFKHVLYTSYVSFSETWSYHHLLPTAVRMPHRLQHTSHCRIVTGTISKSGTTNWQDVNHPGRRKWKCGPSQRHHMTHISYWLNYGGVTWDILGRCSSRPQRRSVLSSWHNQPLVANIFRKKTVKYSWFKMLQNKGHDLLGNGRYSIACSL